MNDVVVPGEDITRLLHSGKQTKIILGPGLRRVAEKVYTCHGGILRKKAPNTYWIDSHRKRYIPQRDELVIGIVTAKQGDYFRVDIGSSELAVLSYQAFEGATKKLRTKVEIGDIIYGRLLTANRDMEPELVCINSKGKSDVMGVLPLDGYLFQCSIDLVRKLLHPNCPFDKLGEALQFEYAIGMNGRIYIRSHQIKRTLALSKAMLASEFLSFKEIQSLCDKLVAQFYNKS
ncbi:exosome complex component RRP40 [Planococcus citri]|uniref:exosome complex component RRP40 n=1 Tax=Planococcus citri TaxID=170843 RepID=UPI0031F8372E